MIGVKVVALRKKKQLTVAAFNQPRLMDRVAQAEAPPDHLVLFWGELTTPCFCPSPTSEDTEEHVERTHQPSPHSKQLSVPFGPPSPAQDEHVVVWCALALAAPCFSQSQARKRLLMWW